MRTRFAPSPTGPLHLGHAFSALTAFEMAHAHSGEFLLRIEDIDTSRARSHWETQVYSDLVWLGLSWEKPVMRQSEQLERYAKTLDQLWEDGLLYACSCNRRDIQNAMSAPQEGAPIGPDGLIYPGTCRHKPRPKIRPKNCNLRLDMARSVQGIPDLEFEEHIHGGAQRLIKINSETLISNVGDAVISRPDMSTSYHLSVVLDDAKQGITDVIRGEDLFDATKIHVLLQRLIRLPTPDYHHHRLIRDDKGKRLAKRDDARAISKYRQDGLSPSELRNLIGLN